MLCAAVSKRSLSGFVLHRIERKTKRLKGGKMKTTGIYQRATALVLRKNRSYVSSLAGLERAMTTDAICEAPAIMCDSENYDLRVDLGGARWYYTPGGGSAHGRGRGTEKHSRDNSCRTCCLLQSSIHRYIRACSDSLFITPCRTA